MINPENVSADESKQESAEASQIRFTDEPIYEVIRREIPLEPEEAKEDESAEDESAEDESAEDETA